MQNITKGLEPANVLSYFEEISAIPRPSGKEDAIATYLVDFAKAQGLVWHRDAANNIVLIKEASPGREAEEALLLQGHMDMVCEQESRCAKDMNTEGLDLAIDGDWLFAKGTTLGGDDGIAVAMILALLSDPTLSHPRLECIITTEEETGMGGAHALDPAPLTGRHLLNIDSEEEGILTVGCAGGEVFGIHLPLEKETASGRPVRIRIDHLAGGHSGIAIDQGHANADRLLLRALHVLAERQSIHLLSLEGGSKNNAIPREAEALLLVEDAESATRTIAKVESTLRSEYDVTDPDLALTCEKADASLGENATVLTAACFTKMLALFTALPNGVQRMDQHLPTLVETSLNLGVLRTEEQEVYGEYLLRSSLDSCLDALGAQMIQITESFGGTVHRADRYPAWEYMPQSAFRDKMIRLFREQYGKDPVVETIHAGLECGLFSKKIPGLDAVSIGPDMRDIHTPQERLSLSSTRRVYAYVRAIIEQP